MRMKHRRIRTLVVILATATLGGAHTALAENPAVEEMRLLYNELQGFKDNAEFRHVIYGRCCEYYKWKIKVEALSGRATMQEFIEGFGILPGELVQLGLDYGRNDIESAQYRERRIAAVRTPLSVVETVNRENEDGIIGEWTAKQSASWMGSHHELERENGKLLMTITFDDGSSGTQTVEEIVPKKGEIRRFRIPGNPHGEYYTILPDGTLGVFDIDGLIFKAQSD